MDRIGKLKQLVDMLRRAAADAREVAEAADNGVSREAALARQIEGIAMEFDFIAQHGTKNGRGA